MQFKKILSIEKALNIIEYISINPNVSIKDICTTLNLKKGTAYSLIKTLEYMNYIKTPPTTARYSLSSKIFQLSKRYEQQTNIPEKITDILKKIKNLFSETSYFAIFSEKNYIFVEKVESDNRIRSHIPIGHVEHLNEKSAIGKIFTSHYEKKEVLEYATNFEETEKGMTCIAFPIVKEESLLGVVGVEGSSLSLTKEKINLLSTQCKEIIAEILSK